MKKHSLTDNFNLLMNKGTKRGPSFTTKSLKDIGNTYHGPDDTSNLKLDISKES